MDIKRITETNDKMNRILRRRFESYFANSELTSVQAVAMEYINVNSADHAVYQKELEKFLELRGSSVSSLIDRLERDGYIRRECHDEDGRYRRLVPTEKGKNIQADISARIMHYTNSLFEGIDEEELEIFEIVMLKIIKNAV
ncbi:MAG: MarR family winged helix-turn-helix transcriptional regulator [Candidatus Coproplasma sp.]